MSSRPILTSSHPRTISRAEFVKDIGAAFRRAEREGYIAVIEPNGDVHAIVSSPSIPG